MAFRVFRPFPQKLKALLKAFDLAFCFPAMLFECLLQV
jgi:hypothetical protein